MFEVPTVIFGTSLDVGINHRPPAHLLLFAESGWGPRIAKEEKKNKT